MRTSNHQYKQNLPKSFSMSAQATLVMSDRGQMAIFIALIFQVLFVFFAMTINVALVVHDKINLQNSADFAAYYGAQKQAEILNAIAHQNYQIRQAWKLTAFRLNVLGQLGESGHPLSNGGIAAPGVPYKHPEVNKKVPQVCVGFRGQKVQPFTWADGKGDDNFCSTPNIVIPKLPDTNSFVLSAGPLSAITAAILHATTRLVDTVEKTCDNQGALNWYMGAKWLVAYMMYQRNNIKVIKGLANTMNKNDFLTLDGAPVSTGVNNTFKKNLTAANLQGGAQLEFFNSISHGSISSYSSWLPKIEIAPTFVYMDLELPGYAACKGTSKSSYERPQALYALETSPLYRQDLQTLKNFSFNRAQEEVYRGDSDIGYTLGVEKNPWVMVYFSVKARSQPREIFSPITTGVEMTAVATAKPFGGRIGPWFGKNWGPGDPQSSGDKVDTQVPDRVQFAGDLKHQIPNYSRYPGDTLGVHSQLAQVSVPAIKISDATTAQYVSIADTGDGGFADILPSDPNSPTPLKIRNSEIASVVPDLFDITYYSIIPNYALTLRGKIESLRDALGIPSGIRILGDIGATPEVPGYSVLNQLEVAEQTGYSNPLVFYTVKNKAHLLTGWVSDTFNKYNAQQKFPVGSFGNCGKYDDKYQVKYRIPNHCIAAAEGVPTAVAGRAGYSVKIVSENFINSSLHQPDPKGPTGAITNPLPGNW